MFGTCCSCVTHVTVGTLSKPSRRGRDHMANKSSRSADSANPASYKDHNAVFGDSVLCKASPNEAAKSTQTAQTHQFVARHALR
jgi:hypothetical protein